MYLTQKNQIRGLPVRELKALGELCRLSKNLYNVGIYTQWQYYFPRWETSLLRVQLSLL
ncbi:hypothetical protein [Arthrospira platensis]|uniref:hypothetical protein n=1 Tax=Limnospira platensis TaxID=118562 RepID=UPI000AA49F89